MSVETYLESLVENSLAKEEASIDATTPQEKWKAAMTMLGQSPSLAQAPPLSDQALSRESIYTREEFSEITVIDPRNISFLNHS